MSHVPWTMTCVKKRFLPPFQAEMQEVITHFEIKEIILIRNESCLISHEQWRLSFQIQGGYDEQYSVSSDVSRFEWESLVIVWVPEYFVRKTGSYQTWLISVEPRKKTKCVSSCGFMHFMSEKNVHTLDTTYGMLREVGGWGRKWVMSHMCMSRVTHVNESCHTCEWVVSHMWMSCVTHEERWGAGVEYHFQEFNEPYAPS